MLEKTRTCLGIFRNPTLLLISSNSHPLNLLLVWSHQADLMTIVNPFIQDATTWPGSKLNPAHAIRFIVKTTLVLSRPRCRISYNCLYLNQQRYSTFFYPWTRSNDLSAFWGSKITLGIEPDIWNSDVCDQHRNTAWSKYSLLFVFFKRSKQCMSCCCYFCSKRPNLQFGAIFWWNNCINVSQLRWKKEVHLEKILNQFEKYLKNVVRL